MAIKIKQTEKESGLLSLEASIALTIFLFLMLFLYSFLVVFEARNQIGHVLLSTADSLALDAFATDTLADDSSLQGVLYHLYGNSVNSNGKYTESSKWYDGEKGSDDSVVETVKTRFLYYLSGGDKTAANDILKKLNVMNGWEGLDFSKSTISGNDIQLQLEYTIEYEFKVFGLATLSFSQSCASKLWK